MKKEVEISIYLNNHQKARTRQIQTKQGKFKNNKKKNPKVESIMETLRIT